VLPSEYTIKQQKNNKLDPLMKATERGGK